MIRALALADLPNALIEMGGHGTLWARFMLRTRGEGRYDGITGVH